MESINKAAFGKIVQAKREEWGLSQRGLAKLMGRSKDYIYKIEKGLIFPDMEKSMPALCGALDVTLNITLESNAEIF